MTREERSALDTFAAAVRAHYGNRLVEMLVFGSRARGDNSEDSDVDVLVILQGSELDFWSEKRVLSDLALSTILAADLHVHAWPVSRAAWDDPSLGSDRQLIAAAKREAKPLASAA